MLTISFPPAGTAEEFSRLMELSETPLIIREAVTRRFDLANKPPEVRAVFSITGGITISTPGNITIIPAHVKSGKSALIGAMISAAMPMATGHDTLGIVSSNAGGHALIHVDTEQCPEDHYAQLERALRRVGLDRAPEWLQSFCLTGWPSEKIWKFIQEAADYWGEQFGGVHSILCDGVADLIRDVNDAAEGNGLVAGIHALAIGHHCPFVGAIHFNPGGEKTRGHLGSQLERKAETNLRLDKNADEIIEVWSAKQRRAPIIKGTGPRFKWSDEAQMHVSIATAGEVRDTEKIEDLKILRDDVFGDRPAMRHCEMMRALKNDHDLSEKTSERRIKAFRKYRLIVNPVANLWNKNDLP